VTEQVIASQEGLSYCEAFRYNKQALIHIQILINNRYLFRVVRSQIIQNVPGGKVNILGGHSIGNSKQESVYVHVSYSERFPR
jgi:hypothetical protein